MKKNLLFIFIFSVSVSLFSCNNNKWKESAPVSFSFTAKEDKAALKTQMFGQLEFVSGIVKVNKLRFTGQRKQVSKQVDIIQYKSEFVTLSINNANSALTIDIPQGTYTQATIGIDIADDGEHSSLIIKGNYILAPGTAIPVCVEYDAGVHLEVIAEAADGADEIVLVADKPINASAELDLGYWFDSISLDLMQEAEISEVDGAETILINDETNVEIYKVIEERISQSVKIIFN